MPNSTLAAIRTKVRRLTRTPSTTQLSDATIDEYINTFIYFDFPEHIRIFRNESRRRIVTIPYVSNYSLFDVLVANQLDDLINKDDEIVPPFYVDGQKVFYSQSPEEFFNIYPQNYTTQQIATGDGLTTSFTGTLTKVPLVENSLTISAVDPTNIAQSFNTVRVFDATTRLPTYAHNFIDVNTAPVFTTSIDVTNFVLNTTGAYVVTFATAPAVGSVITARYQAGTAGKPSGVLFDGASFRLRPIPDSAYSLGFGVMKRPAELLSSTTSPEIKQAWQYIAYGAAKKLFEDRMDLESVQAILPEMKNQERLVLRLQLNKQKHERTATIYSQQASLDAAFGFNNNGF